MYLQDWLLKVTPGIGGLGGPEISPQTSSQL
jgi:hypothetical protein